MGPGNERGSGNELGAWRAEQFPQENYTLTHAGRRANNTHH